MATRPIKASISNCFSLDVLMMMPKERFLLCVLQVVIDAFSGHVCTVGRRASQCVISALGHLWSAQVAFNTEIN